MSKYILSVDLGTTSARCIIFDEKANVISTSGKKLNCFFPMPGWVEQDPDELSASVITCIKETLLKSSLSPCNITALGITNQRETVIVWDKRNGRPLCKAPVWQCNRGAKYIRSLSKTQKELIRKKTGLIPSPYFSASKLAWILDNIPEARKLAESGHLVFGTPDSWLMYRLTGNRAHLTDYTNASRTMLFNIRTLSWDDELLSIFNIPSSVLPEPKPSSAFFSNTDPSLSGSPIPIYGVAGDQQSALFGQCCFDKCDVKITYGTGCFLLMNTGSSCMESKNGLLTTLSAQTEKNTPVYAMEGSVFMGGALISWLKDNLKIIGSPDETAAIAEEVPDTDGVFIVPAFTGLGAPYWKPDAAGIITGLTRNTDRRHIVRAALEAICYQCNDVLRAMESDTGLSITELKADGGVSANNMLIQFQADLTDAKVTVPENIEITAIGAFMLAGLGCGVFKDLNSLIGLVKYNRTFHPEMPLHKRDHLLNGWKEAVKKAVT